MSNGLSLIYREEQISINCEIFEFYLSTYVVSATAQGVFGNTMNEYNKH